MKIALKDHMTRKLITINREAPASEALRLMTNFWIRHLPVLDRNEEFIVGILSERDLLSAPSMSTPVEHLMSAPLKTFDIDTPMEEVVRAMVEEKISAFLVVKSEDVVGIVTSEDMLVLLHEMLKKDDNSQWSLTNLLFNPIVQKTAYLFGQAGI